MADFVLRYTASVGFDRRLALADNEGSLAHAAMLAHVGVLSATDLADIGRGLATIRGEIERGEFNWQLTLEDVHLNVERRLIELVVFLRISIGLFLRTYAIGLQAKAA